jgi:hypothetical protein
VGYLPQINERYGSHPTRVADTVNASPNRATPPASR